MIIGEKMTEWILYSTAGKFLSTMLVSMVPIIELRAGIPYGVAIGLNYIQAFAAAIIGNLIPVPFIIFLIEKVFSIMKKTSKRLANLAGKFESLGDKKSKAVEKYGIWGLFILVALPLPGTGAWTGSLVAALLNIRLKKAIPVIVAGVITAGLLTCFITAGVIHAI